MVKSVLPLDRQKDPYTKVCAPQVAKFSLRKFQIILICMKDLSCEKNSVCAVLAALLQNCNVSI
jgi:hypothetical protein